MMPYNGERAEFSVRVTASGNVRYQVLVEGSDLLLPHPPVVLRHGTDEATMGEGCGSLITLAWGNETTDQCGTSIPSTPLETIALATDEVATVSLDGWSITRASATCGRIQTEPGGLELYEAQPQCTVNATLKDSIITVGGLTRASEPWLLELI